MTDTWPRAMLYPQTERWSRPGRHVSGGQLVSGALAGGRTDGGGFWACKQSGITLSSVAQIKLWRAMEEIVGDGVTQFIVPMCEGRFKPSPAGGRSMGGIPHSDKTNFSDGGGYWQGVITASVHAAAARRATTIVLDMTLAGPLVGGEFFSIDHPTMGRRLYKIGRVASISGTLNTVSFGPPLREAVAGGEVADFDDPGCTMQVASPNDFAVELTNGWVGDVDVAFIEAF
jgi:hypothetical protein